MENIRREGRRVPETGFIISQAGVREYKVG